MTGAGPYAVVDRRREGRRPGPGQPGPPEQVAGCRAHEGDEMRAAPPPVAVFTWEPTS